MKQTRAYETTLKTAAAVPFFRSRWGLLSLLAAGSGLYLYQRRGGSMKSLFGRVWEMGLSARNSIASVAPSVSGAASNSDITGDVGTFGSERISSSTTSQPYSGV